MNEVEEYVNRNAPERFVVVYTVLEKGCPVVEFPLLTTTWGEDELNGI
jgi:hypothetical protein